MTNEIESGRRIDDKRPAGQLEWDGSQAGSGDVSRDVMMDLETLGTQPGAVILSIGAVMFGPDGLGDSFYSPIELTSCTDAGLKICPHTVTWWMNQSDAARDAAFVSDAPPLRDVLMAYADWYLARSAEIVWCHGAGFDAPLLEAAYRACGLRTPWHYASVRDTRTLYDLAGVKPDRSKGTHHNALDDAINQATEAIEAVRILTARTVEREVVAQAAQVAAPDLHNAIMNLPCTRTMSHFATRQEMMAYKEGHRDARHAAAELSIGCEAATPSTAAVRAAEWISVDERLPEGECLAVYVTPAGKQRLIRAKYVRQFQEEASADEIDQCETECKDDENDDTLYLKAGWLECIDNWGEYSSCYVVEGVVTHWQALPPVPAADGGNGGE